MKSGTALFTQHESALTVLLTGGVVKFKLMSALPVVWRTDRRWQSPVLLSASGRGIY